MADEAAIANNVGKLLRDLVGAAAQRHLPTLAMANDWHRRIYADTSSAPVPVYLGGVRGSLPELSDYEVVLMDLASHRITALAVPAADVAAELVTLESAIQTAVDGWMPSFHLPEPLAAGTSCWRS